MCVARFFKLCSIMLLHCPVVLVGKGGAESCAILGLKVIKTVQERQCLNRCLQFWGDMSKCTNQEVIHDLFYIYTFLMCVFFGVFDVIHDLFLWEKMYIYTFFSCVFLMWYVLGSTGNSSDSIKIRIFSAISHNPRHQWRDTSPLYKYDGQHPTCFYTL